MRMAIIPWYRFLHEGVPVMPADACISPDITVQGSRPRRSHIRVACSGESDMPKRCDFGKDPTMAREEMRDTAGARIASDRGGFLHGMRSMW